MALIVLFISTLFSQDSFPDRVTDPVSIKDEFYHQLPEEHFNHEAPFSRPDFQNDNRPRLEKGSQIEDDYHRRFESKRPLPQFIYNKHIADSVWTIESKLTYTYDTNGNMTEELQQWWDWENNVWANLWKKTFAYDANGNTTETLGQFWNNNAWVNGKKRINTYDANGYKTEWLGQSWRDNTWVNGGKETYTYDANGYKTEWLWQSWRDNAWMNRGKYTYTYDANGNMTELLKHLWRVILAITYNNSLPEKFKLTQNYPILSIL